MKNRLLSIICVLCLVIILMFVGCEANKGPKGYEGLKREPTTETDHDAIKNDTIEYFEQFNVLLDAALNSAIKDTIKIGDPSCTWDEASSLGQTYSSTNFSDMIISVARVLTNENPTGYITLIHYDGRFYINDYAFEGDPSFGSIEDLSSSDIDIIFVGGIFAWKNKTDEELIYTEFGSDKIYTMGEILEINKKYIKEFLG